MIKEWICSICLRIENHIVRKQTLSILPDGTFVCETNGKKHYLKHPLEGLIDD